MQNVITQFCDTIVESCSAEYLVGREIGEGVSSFVYVCTERNTNRILAMKAPKCAFKYEYDNSTYAVASLDIIVHHTGVTVFDENAQLSRENIFWISNLRNFDAPFVGVYQVGNKYHPLNLKHCITIWGFDPFTLFDDPVFAINEQQIVRGDRTTYKVPIVPNSYHHWINRRHHLLQEVVALNKIGIHPNIVRFHKLLEKVTHNKSMYFLIYDYARGGDLSRMMIKLRIMEESMARVMFTKIFIALKLCHAKEVFHLDIKPNNILLKYSNIDMNDEFQHEWKGNDEEKIYFQTNYQMDKEDFVMLADFGLSVVFGHVDEAHSTTQNIYNPHQFVRRVFHPRGTPGFMAPATVLHGNYDPSKADMFSLGCTLYHVIVGYTPFHRDPMDIYDVVNSPVFRSFKDWVTTTFDPTLILGEKAWVRNGSVSYPESLFPVYISVDAKNLLTLLLHPNPERRISFSDDLMSHPWLVATTTTTADVGIAFEDSKQVGLKLPDSWEGTLALDGVGSQDWSFFPSYHSSSDGGNGNSYEQLSGNKRERESEVVRETGRSKTATLFFSKIPWGQDYGQPDSKGNYEFSVIYESEAEAHHAPSDINSSDFGNEIRINRPVATSTSVILELSSSESSTTTSPDPSLDEEAIDIEGNVSYSASEALLAV